MCKITKPIKVLVFLTLIKQILAKSLNRLQLGSLFKLSVCLLNRLDLNQTWGRSGSVLSTTWILKQQKNNQAESGWRTCRGVSGILTMSCWIYNPQLVQDSLYIYCEWVWRTVPPVPAFFSRFTLSGEERSRVSAAAVQHARGLRVHRRL